jgi:acylphosphatase
MRQITLRVMVDGVVQGVGYREWTVSEATTLGLNGWVRNRRDGTVEAAVSGPTDKVQELLGRLRKGPKEAQVAGVSAESWRETVGDGFQIAPTV